MARFLPEERHQFGHGRVDQPPAVGFALFRAHQSLRARADLQLAQRSLHDVVGDLRIAGEFYGTFPGSLGLVGGEPDHRAYLGFVLWLAVRARFEEVMEQLCGGHEAIDIGHAVLPFSAAIVFETAIIDPIQLPLFNASQGQADLDEGGPAAVDDLFASVGD